jgi:hypothetical protein
VTSGGWGIGGWGVTGWGVPGSAGELQLLSAIPLRENVVRLQFSKVPYFTRLLDPSDASSRKRYSIVPVDGSLDDDGDPTRPVFPTLIEVAALAFSGGSAIDVAVDRPFSSWPSKYIVAVNGMKAVDGSLLDPNRTSAVFDGLQYAEGGGAARPAVSAGDFANPQTLDGIAVGVSPQQAAILGSYPIGPSGDYATDVGIDSYKKRIIRRLLSRKGGFAGLPASYGLGAQERLKKLFRGSDATALAADARTQVLADPETASATVDFVPQPGGKSIGYFRIKAVHISGASVQTDVPFNA